MFEERERREKVRIGIIGLGYVGLTMGIVAAGHGIEVYGTEVNAHIKACLKENRAHFYEPGLDSLVRKVNNRSFYCVDEFPKEKAYDAFIITVGTPLKKGGKRPNFEYIKSALCSLKEVYTGDELVVLRSTVSVGTTRNTALPFLAGLTGRREENLYVSMCPERTVEGKAVEELTRLPQIVSGNNKRAVEAAEGLFRKITPYVIPADSLEEAELVKLYCNIYRDISFSIGNVFCCAAQGFGVDGIRAIGLANQGYARAGISLPGFVAGPCLEKDAYILTNNMQASPSREFIMGARKFNESLEDMVVEWAESQAVAGEKTLVLSGMAFKGVPETSDLRGSSSVYIAEKLKRKGYALRLHDFVALQDEVEALDLGEVYADIYEACEGASVLLVLNNHKKYGLLESRREMFGMAVLDAWDVCVNLKNDDRVNVSTLGNMFIK